VAARKDKSHSTPGRYLIAKGSNQLITPATTLWRYMTFEKFCWLIESGELYHARLDQFSDPFEGAVSEKYARLRDTIEPNVDIRRFEQWSNKTSRLYSYASCWHASDYESDSQWRLYGSGGAGIAIVSTMERMRDSVDFSPDYGLLRQVEYGDFKTHTMRDGTSQVPPGFLKRKSFEHEREVRGIIQAKDPFFKETGPDFTFDDSLLKRLEAQMPRGIEPKVRLRKLIQSIVISPIAAAYVEELVRRICKRHGLGALVRRSDLCGTPLY
jgi:hypothetical protein